MEVIKLDARVFLQETFLRVPDSLRAGDELYIPPSRRQQAALIGALECPSLDNGFSAAHFLACEGGRTLGRVSAFYNPSLHPPDGTPVGCVGQFECRNDFAAANALLRTATTWLAQEFGIRRIWGPLNGSLWNGYRFMISGFDQDIFVGEPYNPPYYPRFFEDFGFRRIQEWDSLFVAGEDRILPMIARGEEKLTLMREGGYRFESFDKKRRTAQITDLWATLQASYAGFLGFTPISLERFTALFEQFEPLLDPDLFLLTYAPAGNCVGFAVALPDYPRATRAMAGQDHLLARFTWRRLRDRRPRLNFYLGGITPEIERAALGLGRAGFYYILRRALDKGYREIILSLRSKGNYSRALAARSGLKPQHEYALYEYCYEP